MARLEVNVGQIVEKAIRDQFRSREPGLRVLGEVWEERGRQDEKWGEQNHPDGTGPDVDWTRHIGPAHVVRDTYRDLTDYHADNAEGEPLTWLDILREEIGEAFAEDDPAKLRTELVQVAAVCVQWAQAIDRRGAAPGGDA